MGMLYLNFEEYANRDVNPNYTSASRDVRKEIIKLKKKKVDGIIIDLRANGGGSLVEAVDLTGLFIKEGPVVQVRDRLNRVQVNNDRNPEIAYAGPIAVMVNRGSASASEIFSAAIQDYGRGIIVGSQTYGKGTVQQLVPLNRYLQHYTKDLGGLKLTRQKYYRIDGGSTQNKGVIPDIFFPSIDNSADYGESSFDTALPWDKIEKAKYSKVGDISSHLPQLKVNHENRIKNNVEFQIIQEVAKEYKEKYEEISISLNEEARKKERERSEKTKLDRKNRRRVAQGLKPLKKGETEKEKLKDMDAELDETAMILTDYILISNQLNLASESKN